MVYSTHYIVTDSPKKKEWKRIIFDGVKTNYEIRENGDVRNRSTGSMLTPLLGSHGYLKYNFYINGKYYRVRQHRLLACIFIPIPKELYDKDGLVPNKLILEVNHKDSDRTNNDLTNLEWVTHKGNMEHAARDNRLLHNNSSITEKQAMRIIKMLESGKYRINDIAKKIGTSRSTISRIYQRKLWADLSEGHDFSKVPTSNFNSEEDIIEVCELLASGDYCLAEIRDLTGISKDIIFRVYNRDLWKDISSKYNFDYVPKSRNSVLARVICEMIEEGLSTSEICELTNASKSMVKDIRRGKTHQDIAKDYNFSMCGVNDEVVHQVCKLIEEGNYNDREISEKVGNVSRKYVNDIRLKKNRTNISSLYNF